MQILRPRLLLGSLACLAASLSLSHRVGATGVPVSGFYPLVGIGLTDEYSHDTDFDYTFFVIDSDESTLEGGTFLGANGTPHYEMGLLDTGAGLSLLTSEATAAFALGDSYPERSQGFEGSNPFPIGGATGQLDTTIQDPLGLYVGGVQGRATGNPFTMTPGNMKGQLNTSLVAMPPEAALPNVIGLSFASQYATHVLNSQPQVFSVGGQTVRAPAIEFHERGNGGLANTPYLREMQINPGTSFLTPPFYFPDFGASDFTEDPSQPSVIQGGLFFDASVSDEGASTPITQFFFDTGADVSVVSRSVALSLGFDVTLDTPEFTIAVVGSGGTRLEVPGFIADTLTIPVLGHPDGKLEFHNVPLLVLNVTNPANIGNVVPGIIGTNVLAGRDLVIDPDPSDGSGNQGPELYISDQLTTDANWTSAAASGSWGLNSNWSTSAVPTIAALKIANVRHASGGNQEAVVSSNAEAWEINVSGAGASQKMTLRIQASVKLTTFAGLNVEPNGVASLEGGVLDVQYVDIRGGSLAGFGTISTGSGPVPGQVENISGVVAPGIGVGTLTIEGRYSNGKAGALEMEIGGTSVGTQHDQLAVLGDVTLAGALNVALVNLFAPAIGNTFTLIDATGQLGGKFDSISLPALPADRMWAVLYQPSAFALKVTIPGDYDGSGAVNSSDLAAWKTLYAKPYLGGDFLTWQRKFSGGGVAGVPEPGALTLAVMATIAAIARRRAARPAASAQAQRRLGFALLALILRRRQRLGAAQLLDHQVEVVGQALPEVEVAEL